MKDKVHVETRYTEDTFEGRFAWFWRMSYWIDSFGEARGVDRQPPEERVRSGLRGWLNQVLIWLGACGSLSSMSGFFIGPLLFDLDFKNSMSAGICGAFAGSLVAGFGAVMGPRSGLRQMVSVRFQFGWWPAKFIALLNVLTLLGWAVISLVFGGELLAAISDRKIPLEVGIVIITVVSLVVAVFGINFVTKYDMVFVGPALITFLLVYVATGNEWPANSQTELTGQNLAAGWLSFFSSSIGITSTWVALASDYYLDLPETTNPWTIYLFATCMIFFTTIFVGIPGIGLGCAAKYTNDKWMAAYEDLSTGGLLAESLTKWHGGGKFLVVVMFISLVTNNILNTYSIPLSAQVFGRIWTKVPRYCLVIVTAAIYFVLAMAGREKLFTILENFMPMIGYWSMMYSAILIIETLVFRRGEKNEYQWANWNDPKSFPFMYAAVFSFCCGIAGCVVGMNQAYWQGPLALLVGEGGADLGMFLSLGFTAVVYLPTRYLEIRLRGKPIRP